MRYRVAIVFPAAAVSGQSARIEDTRFAAVAAALREAGIALTVEPKTGRDNNRQCWIEDPDGNRIEFMQMSDGSMQAAAIERLRRMG